MPSHTPTPTRKFILLSKTELMTSPSKHQLSLVSVLFLLLSFGGSAQEDPTIDSLKTITQSTAHDSVRVNALVAWDNLIYYYNPEQDLVLNEQIKEICLANLKKDLKEIETAYFKEKLANSYNNLGIIAIESGDPIGSIEFNKSALVLREEIGFKNSIATTHLNMGNAYLSFARYPDALDHFYQAIEITKEAIAEQTDSSKIESTQFIMADTYMGIGQLYKDLNDVEKAQENFELSLELHESGGNLNGVAKANNNLGTLFAMAEDYENALSYFVKSKELKILTGDLRGEITSCINIGGVYENTGFLDSAEIEFKNGLEISEKYNDAIGLSNCHFSLGKLYTTTKEHHLAKSHLVSAVELAKQAQNYYVLQVSYEQLSILGELTGDFKNAIEWRKSYEMYADSILSDEDARKIVQQEFAFEYDLKKAQDSIEFVKSKEIDQLQIERQEADLGRSRVLLIASFVGLILLIAFAIIIAKRLKISQKQKKTIESQKLIVDQKNKEIHDSINYAERIQKSFLATEELLNQNLGEHFIYFNPKEAVSGDFYWAGKLDNGNFAVSCADSTGHGVPGAIMSILNISSIEKAVENKASKPAEIFNQARKLIIERLKKDGSPEGGKDGMDASLIAFNPEKTIMQYVAAHNPIWIIRAGELIDIKAEKMPVGKHDHDHIPFEGGEFELQKGDIIYTLTDGFQDQFGGEKGKKYKVKPFKRLLLENAHLAMSEQHQKISDTFDEWKRDLEQVDDVCVIGVRV
jgi:serine phosphatase RsbU (regulator of sigma subunit)